MKVKIIETLNPPDLEEEINEFIEDKQIIDIKFECSTSRNNNFYYQAMIMYKSERG